MSNLYSSYTKILSVLHEFEPADNFLDQIRIPKLLDKELITITLAAEALGIDSERYLFKRLPEQLSSKIERSGYNRRRRQLTRVIEKFRLKLVDQVASSETHYLVDSMSLETCKFSRAKRSRVCREDEYTAPDYGYCAVQKTHYFGYKIHAVCTQQGILKNFDISMTLRQRFLTVS